MTVSEERVPVAVWRSWLETIVLTGATPVLGLAFQPEDPVFASGRFFWPILAPLIAALRYGVGHGVAGAVLLGASVIWSLGPGRESGLLAAATLLVALVAGEFSEYWQRRLDGAERAMRLTAERTTRLARAYHAVVASHERLERTRLGETPSMRELLSDLQRDLARERSLATAGETLLKLLALHFGVRQASFHPVVDGGAVLPALANLGVPVSVSRDDAVVREAVREKGLVSVDSQVSNGLLAAVALADSTGEVVALVAIREMPWESLQPGALRALAVTAGRAADILRAGRAESTEWERDAFVSALMRTQDDLRRHGFPGTVLSIDVPMEAQAALREAAISRRAHDVATFVPLGEDQTRLALVLPLTDEAGAEVLAGRIRTRFRALLPTLDEESVHVSVRGLTLEETVEARLASIQDRRPADAPRLVARLAGP